MSGSRFAQNQTKHALLAVRTADQVLDALDLFHLGTQRKNIELGYTIALLRLMQQSRDRGIVDVIRRREKFGIDAPLVTDVVPTEAEIYERHVAKIVPQIKQLTAKFGSATRAREIVRARMHGAAHVMAQAPARQVIQDSAEAARVAQKTRGWRRAAGVGRAPCGWCAVLIARGVIRDRELQAGGGRKYHRWCSCQPVEVVELWTPTSSERHLVEARDAVRHDHPDASATEVAALLDRRLNAERAEPKKTARPTPLSMPGRTPTRKAKQPTNQITPNY